jgi:hypothetical protein
MTGKPPRVPKDWDDSEPTATAGGDSKGPKDAGKKPDSTIGGPAGQH